MTDLSETALRARQMYLDGVTVAKIRADTGLTIDEFYAALDGKAKKNSPQLLSPIPRRQARPRLLKRAKARLRLVRRVMRGAEKEMSAIEERLGTGSSDTVRSLAMLSRTLRELKTLEEALDSDNAPRKAATIDDDAIPQDLDQLRQELSRRLAQIVDGQEG